MSTEAPGSQTTVPSLAVAPAALRRRLDLASLPFESTAEVEPLAALIGQPRVLDAISFGVEMDGFGYNLFLAGAPGSGRMETIRDYLAQFAPTRPPADDWVYVHDFGEPQRPHAIRLPPGRARELAADMDDLIVAARRHIGMAFDSEAMRSAGGRHSRRWAGSVTWSWPRCAALPASTASRWKRPQLASSRYRSWATVHSVPMTSGS